MNTVSNMMKLNLNCIKMLRHSYCSKKWSVPEELLNSEASMNKATALEKSIKSTLQKSFPAAENIEVKDLSGNCGSMFEVIVVSKDFKGLSLVEQHKLVTTALNSDIRNMHGITIETKVP